MPDRPFSEAERRRLSPFVTDLDGPVFVLTNLPEEVKGALFSRYSRSTLGLRELLLKEFLVLPAMREAADHASESALSLGEGVNLDRAREFFDRILDGYGDDSIGELGGAHIAIEDVSMIATKILEDPRIGGSPLEKSTRYVSFADQVNGEYRFLQEPRLVASKHKETYIKACRMLFQTYDELFPVMHDWFERLSPRQPGETDSEYRRIVKARAYDSVRGLLPASALTNMGIYGNGRFFEALLLRLRLIGMAEADRIADDVQRELSKVIPSFIRRAESNHPHFAAYSGFRRELREIVRDVAALLPRSDRVTTKRAEARLVGFDADAEARVLASLAFPATDAPLPVLREWAAGLTEAERERIFGDLAGIRGNRRHKLPRALETVRYTFDLVGDFGMYRDLHRHRMLTQERQPLTTRLGFTRPEEIDEAGLRDRFDSAMAAAADAFEAIAADLPAEAQYVVPMAYRIRWFVEISLRELVWLVELRSGPEGHPAYRRMAQEMFLAVQSVHPNLADMIRFVDLDDYVLGRRSAGTRQTKKRIAQTKERKAKAKELQTTLFDEWST